MITKQKGFGAAAVVVAIALLALLGAVIARSMTSPISNTSKSENKLLAAAVLMQSAKIKDAVNILITQNDKILDGSYIRPNTDDLSQDGFGDWYVGLYNTQNGTMDEIKPPAKAVSADTSWDFTVSTPVTQVSPDTIMASDSSYVILNNVMPNVCVAINDALRLPTTPGARARITTTSGVFCDEDNNIFYNTNEITLSHY